jgi:hypothetical protein
MKQLRTRLAASVRSTIDTHIGLLDALAKDPPEEPSLGISAAFLARGSPDPDPARSGPDATRSGPDATSPSPDATGPGPDATSPGPDA